MLVPFSGMDLSIAKLLVEAGYLKSAEKKTIGKKHYIEISLLYEGKEPAMSDFKLLSKPSRHLYTGYRDLSPVRQHYGLAVLSTPSGIMTNRQARKKKVGGEYLFEIW